MSTYLHEGKLITRFIGFQGARRATSFRSLSTKQTLLSPIIVAHPARFCIMRSFNLGFHTVNSAKFRQNVCVVLNRSYCARDQAWYRSLITGRKNNGKHIRLMDVKCCFSLVIEYMLMCDNYVRRWSPFCRSNEAAVDSTLLFC